MNARTEFPLTKLSNSHLDALEEESPTAHREAETAKAHRG